MQTYGPRLGSRTLRWAKCKIFLEALFICNNTNKNLNKNFHTSLRYHSFKPVFLFFQISATSSLKKFENKKWPKAGYLPLYPQPKVWFDQNFSIAQYIKNLEFWHNNKTEKLLTNVLFQMNLLIFQNLYEFISIFFTFFKIPFLTKILLCDTESWYKNISKIRNVTFISQNFQKHFQKRKKNSKIQMVSKKSINWFEMRKTSHVIGFFFVIC